MTQDLRKEDTQYCYVRGMDKFPEAFRRFERRVDVDGIQSFYELLSSFSHWAGKSWRGTEKQVNALKVEAWKRDIPVPAERKLHKVRMWRHETVTVRGKLQIRYRDLKIERFIKKPFEKVHMSGEIRT